MESIEILTRRYRRTRTVLAAILTAVIVAQGTYLLAQAPAPHQQPATDPPADLTPLQMQLGQLRNQVAELARIIQSYGGGSTMPAAQSGAMPGMPGMSPAAPAGGGMNMGDVGMKRMGMMGMGGMGMTMPMQGQMAGNAIEHGEGHIAFIKAELKITAAQGKVWDEFAAAMRANVKQLNELRAELTKAGTIEASPVDRIAQQEKILAARLEIVRRTKPALTALYATFSDDQKKTFGQLVSHRMGMR